VSKSGSEGRRLDEAKTINRSIAALGNCIAALAGPRRAAHVPSATRS
jgi:kinesin family member 5